MIRRISFESGEQRDLFLMEENHAVTPGLVAGSFLIMLSMVEGVPIPMNADNRGEMNEVSPDKLFTLVQTRRYQRRGDRRDTKQDCRQADISKVAISTECANRRAATEE